MITKEKTYDYIFAGYGAAASLLLLQLHKKKRLDHVTILIVDPATKTNNDKTFCFWANEQDDITKDLKDLIKFKWSKIATGQTQTKSISPLHYQHIASIDLYEKIQELERIYHWDKLVAPVEDIVKNESGTCIIVNGTPIQGKLIFDSRTPLFKKIKKGETHIFQSFIGWEIETQLPIQDPAACRLMDFDVAQNNSTQFMYVLPFTPNTTLVELTRFGATVLSELEAKELLTKYIQQHFGEFTIKAVEKGCIPMSNCEIENEAIDDVILLGAKNYTVKPSTGYAFKNMYQRASEVANSLDQSIAIPKNTSYQDTKTGRYAFYDSLLLTILKDKPQKGKNIFQALFNKTDILLVLKFLDQKTTLKEDIHLFAKLPWAPFIQALFKLIPTMTWFRPLVVLLLSILLFTLGSSPPTQDVVGYGLFITGLITVGIPHGAVDHLLETGNWESSKMLRFIVLYLLQAAAIGLIWYLLPTLALFTFLAYSAWHFGQADGKQWKFKAGISLLWGMFVLFYILGTHLAETNAITTVIGKLSLPFGCPIWVIIPWLLWSAYRKQYIFSIALLTLLISTQLPLLFAFGFYFIGQHSLTGWQHIKEHLNQSHLNVWLKALPFHIGAWLLFFTFLLFSSKPNSLIGGETAIWGQFFVFIACLSLPHAISMHRLYNKKAYGLSEKKGHSG